MELLIKRDPVKLIPVEGKVEIKSEYSSLCKLTTPMIVREGEHYTFLPRFEDIFVLDETDKNILEKHLEAKNKGLWSGRRSVLIRGSDDNLYKLKGVALNLEKPDIRVEENNLIHIEGGELKYETEYEEQMSDKFNKILRNEGIEPVIEVIGRWNYPAKAKRRRISASISKIKGDTRLDELLYAIEITNDMVLCAGIEPFLKKDMRKLYWNLGYIVGRLKKIMDKNNQTWGADYHSTNAHIGNVVLYPENDKIALGIVDFDASCDTTDFSKSKLKKLQEKEYELILRSAMTYGWTLRRIILKGSNIGGWYFPKTYLRKVFNSGFGKGYSQNVIKTIDNKIERGLVEHIFFVLRNNEPIERIVQHWKTHK